MTAAESLDRGRGSLGRHAWADAYAELSAADHEAPLEVTDLERLAMAAYLVGLDDDGDEASARAFQECLRLGEIPRAARCAFWLGLGLLFRGEVARGSGWLARARHRRRPRRGRDRTRRPYTCLAGDDRLRPAVERAAHDPSEVRHSAPTAAPGRAGRTEDGLHRRPAGPTHWLRAVSARTGPVDPDGDRVRRTPPADQPRRLPRLRRGHRPAGRHPRDPRRRATRRESSPTGSRPTFAEGTSGCAAYRPGCSFSATRSAARTRRTHWACRSPRCRRRPAGLAGRR